MEMACDAYCTYMYFEVIHLDKFLGPRPTAENRPPRPGACHASLAKTVSVGLESYRLPLCTPYADRYQAAQTGPTAVWIRFLKKYYMYFTLILSISAKPGLFAKQQLVVDPSSLVAQDPAKSKLL
eukprot:SAG31_NODE_4340_length_3340_cov_3.282012_4_plen_125_part_00